MKNILIREYYNFEAMTKYAANKLIVVVIDDDPEILLLLSRYFRNSTDLNLYLFESGAEALQHQDILTIANLLIIDIRLNREEGFNLDKMIQYRRSFKMPTIYISSNHGNEEAVKRISDEDKIFIGKPFSKEKILNGIRYFLNKSIWLRGLADNLLIE